jgi:predicted dehydrogenase
VLAVADVNRKHAQDAAERFNIPHVFSDYRDLLALDGIDAVSVTTPNAHHAAPSIAALKAGKHVLCEKPIAMNAREATRMVTAARNAKRQLMVAHQHRFRSDVQALKRAIDDGALGDIYYAESNSLRRRGIPGWGVFVQKEHSGGGPLIDIGVHILDVTLYLMGHPQPVAASACTYTAFGKRKGVYNPWGTWDPRKYTVEDMAVGFVRFKNGASMVVKSSWAANIRSGEFDTWLLGTDGGCRLDPLGIFREEHGGLVNIEPTELPRVDGYLEEVRAFVEAIRRAKPVPIPGEQALITQKILDALYRSAEEGKEVAIR